MSSRDAAGDAAEVLARCDELARISARDDGIERVHLTPEHRRANDLVQEWMLRAGLTTWVDHAGNVCGRREGRVPGLPALLLGSHLDTVPDAGRYDGMLGVVLAVAVAERLGERVGGLPFALEVIGFSDEEGTRFGKALLGSSAAAGLWQQEWWELCDADGTTLREAAEAFGLDPAMVGRAARRTEDLVGYLEAHIEQGPLLEEADAALGYVTTIAGAHRFSITVLGEARHAGGTPYPRRRDALVGASEMITMVERRVRDSGCVATVGRIEVHPGAVNVIAGRAELSLDLRAGTDAERDAMERVLLAEMEEIAAARGLRLEVVRTHTAAAAHTAERLREAVIAGIAATGDDAPLGLWSRAGHDAMVMAAVTDIAMLFVRCHDGISHHPGEAVRADDVERALVAFEAAVLATADATAGGSAGGDVA